MSRSGLLVVTLATLAASTGATCVPHARLDQPLAPVAFPQPPSLDEIAFNLNSQTARVSQLQTDSASVSTRGFPGLRAQLAIERPRRFRLRGKLFGPEIDLGSNDELLWFWAKADPQKAVYFAHHSSLDNPQLSLPIRAEWLVEAFGLIEIAPGDVHEGPFQHSEDHAEIRTRMVRGGRELIRTLVVNVRYGWVKEQQIYNHDGTLLAAVQMEDHRYDEFAGVSLPHRIRIQLPPAELSFTIEVAGYRINVPPENPQEMWQIPAFEGSQRINLANMLLNQTPAHVGPPAGYGSAGRTAFRPRFRGQDLR